MANLFIIGLTGPTGAGKSEASRVFYKLGAYIIDADVLSRRAVEKGSPCLEELVQHFSEDILNSDGTLNRAALAKKAFSSPKQTQILNSIVHPAVIRMVKEEVNAATKRGYRVSVIDAPLLFQAGLEEICDITVAVTAPSEERLKRICIRDGLNHQQAVERMNAQPDERYYTDRATYTIKNTGDLDALKGQLLSVWDKCKKRPVKLRQILKNVLIPVLILLLSVGILCKGNSHYIKKAYPLQYLEEVEHYSKEFGITPSLIYGVIYTESRFYPQAASNAGAKGLMQITDGTFKWVLGKLEEETGDIFDPKTNIRCGTKILQILYDQFECTETVLAAYNGGIGNVRKWLADSNYSSDGKTLHTIPFSETREYVSRVLKAQKMYQTLYEIP